MLLFLSALAAAAPLPAGPTRLTLAWASLLLAFPLIKDPLVLLLLLLLWKPMTWTELLWATELAGSPGGLPFVATNDLSTDVERCIEMRLPDEDRSADEQRAGRGGRPEAVTLGPLYPLPEVRNGLLYDLLMVE